MWEQIRSNRRRSAFVIAGMGALLVATGAALGFFFGSGAEAVLIGGASALALWLVLWMVMLTSGDSIMLNMAGAREIHKKDHPQLFNIVEEMTIAAALPKMPAVYVVDDPAPNAFATGRNPDKAAVAVTTGLLRVLDRDELQGVVAHEIGHIKNQDVRLITTAGIMVGAIVLLAELGMRWLWWGGGGRRGRDSDNGSQAVVMIASLILLILAPFFAQLVYFALSRRREYLADASGAMFTRNPEGLASALEKISGIARPQADHSRITAPMYIIRPLRPDERRKATSSFSTHPPVADRIKVLRSMAGGAGWREYEQAYERLHRGKHVVGDKALGSVPEVAAAPSAVAAAGAAERIARARKASDAYLSASGYEMRTCKNCGATVKIPPSITHRVTNCPRCYAELPPAA